MQLIWVTERLGASSRRPLATPFSALMAGVNPGPVPVHRALPDQDSRNCIHTDSTRGTAAHQDVDHHRVHLHGENP